MICQACFRIHTLATIRFHQQNLSAYPTTYEGDHHNLYREVPPEVWFEGDKLLKRMMPPQLVYSGTSTSALVDWVVGVYVPNLLATGTVPPPPEPSPEEKAKALRREQRRLRPRMTRREAALNASKHAARRYAKTRVKTQ